MRTDRKESYRRGRDRKAVVLLPRSGRDRVTGEPRSAAVIGGGIAGLAAATGLAERGVRVTLYEREDTLGGRAGGTRVRLHDGTTATATRGFHAFFRQYYNLRGLLRRSDPKLCSLTPLPDYPLLHSSGLRDSFRRIPRTPPYNAVGFAFRSPTFALRDLVGLRPAAALPLLDVRVPEVYTRLDQTSAQDFLAAVRFPEAARRLAFDVFSRSFFADPHRLSAAEMALMFHIYFLGSSEGLLFDVPREPFTQALWGPLGDYLRGHGADLRLAEPVISVVPSREGGFRVITAYGERRHDAVVLALDTAGLRQLVGASPSLATASWREGIARLRTAPAFLVSRLWLDRGVAPGRPGFLATSGFGPLDNISVLERWEGEAARWSARTGGSVVELHAYAVGDGAAQATTETGLVRELHRVYPETAAARVLDAVHQWHDDCPLFAPGGYWARPTVRTPDPALTVAGDLVRPFLPVALMERAATTGFLASNALLERWGVRGQPLWTVPPQGRSPWLRAVARTASWLTVRRAREGPPVAWEQGAVR